jgi:hypothetical protein
MENLEFPQLIDSCYAYHFIKTKLQGDIVKIDEDIKNLRLEQYTKEMRILEAVSEFEKFQKCIKDKVDEDIQLLYYESNYPDTQEWWSQAKTELYDDKIPFVPSTEVPSRDSFADKIENFTKMFESYQESDFLEALSDPNKLEAGLNFFKKIETSFQDTFKK